MKKSDLSDFEHGVVAGVRVAGLIFFFFFPETADLLEFSHTTNSRVFRVQKYPVSSSYLGVFVSEVGGE